MVNEIIEGEFEPEVSPELSLDDLTEDTEVSLVDLFESEENVTSLAKAFIQNLTECWAKNDRIIKCICKPGYTEAIKQYLTTLNSEEVAGVPESIYRNLVDIVEWETHESVENLRLVTLKQVLGVQEVICAGDWANQESIRLYDTLNALNLTIQPTMDELRLLVLIDTLLDIRERNKTRIEVPGRIPMGVR